MYGEKITQLQEVIAEGMTKLVEGKIEGHVAEVPTLDEVKDDATDAVKVQVLRGNADKIEDALHALKVARRDYDRCIETIQLAVRANSNQQYGQRDLKKIAFGLAKDEAALACFTKLVEELKGVEKLEFAPLPEKKKAEVKPAEKKSDKPEQK